MTPFTAVDALAEALPLVAVPDDQVVTGSPRTGQLSLGHVGGARLGVWEMTAGAMRDVEVDEVFVVLEGEAEVVFLTGTDEVSRLALRPGMVVRLAAGSTTRWTVPDRLRKFYVAS